MSLAYKPSGSIPGYKPMGFYAGWAYMRGNTRGYIVLLLLQCLSNIISCHLTENELIYLRTFVPLAAYKLIQPKHIFRGGCAVLTFVLNTVDSRYLELSGDRVKSSR